MEFSITAFPKLSSLDQLGSGGEGTVYRLRADQGPDELQQQYALHSFAVKKFNEPDSDAEAQHHAAMVALLEKANPAQRTWMLEHMAWPLATLHDAGKTVGIVMPLIPKRFFRDFPRAGGGVNHKEADIQKLLNPPEYLQRMGLSMSQWQRLEILRATADMLRVLHGAEIAVGDFSARNLMFSFAHPQRPAQHPTSMYFIDCDSFSLRGSRSPNAMETPQWTVPRGEDAQTIYADRYRFSLLVIRLLVGDQGVKDSAALQDDYPELADLAAAGLDETPEQRTDMHAWLPALEQAAASADRSIPVVSSPAGAGAVSQPSAVPTQVSRHARSRRVQPGQVQISQAQTSHAQTTQAQSGKQPGVQHGQARKAGTTQPSQAPSWSVLGTTPQQSGGTVPGSRKPGGARPGFSAPGMGQPKPPIPLRASLSLVLLAVLWIYSLVFAFTESSALPLAVLGSCGMVVWGGMVKRDPAFDSGGWILWAYSMFEILTRLEGHLTQSELLLLHLPSFIVGAVLVVSTMVRRARKE